MRYSRRQNCGFCPRREDNSKEKDLRVIVEDYIKTCRPITRAELSHFCRYTFRQAIEAAALSKLPDGKRHAHQCRIPARVLSCWREGLLKQANQLSKCKTFPAIFELVEAVGARVWGIGALTIYDTAQRIAVNKGIEPEKVYLHAGTKEGARALGLSVGKGFLVRRELPKEFSRLRLYEIEDCLCIYKDHLGRIKPTV